MPTDNLNLDSCMKCSDCNTACPVFKVYPSYPGPKFLGPELERIRKEAIACDIDWVEYCTGCGRCDLVCPNQVKICEMIAAAKAEHKKKGVRGWRDRLFARPGLLGKGGSIAPRWTEKILRLTVVRFLLSRLLDISPDRALPAYAPSRLAAQADEANAKERILYFPGCFVQFNAPDVGRAVIDVLHRNGFAVDVGSFRCCGLPSMANGDREEMLRNARHNVLEMRQTVETGGRIVSGCSSCSFMLKATYPELFPAADPLGALAQDVSRSTYDLGELLSSLVLEGKLNMRMKPIQKSLAYHVPCHLKAQGVGTPWLTILSEISGIDIVDTNAGCCGVAGTYGFKKEKYAISMDVGKELFDAMRICDPDLAVTECAMCQEQIRHGTGLKTSHPVMILAQAYALADKHEEIA
jgi:glycerol-3-phosphate dehydrogenase subunit C